MGVINYPRHFAYLALAAGLLLFVQLFTPWPLPFTFFFGLVGALHALALVAALRAGPTWRRLTFVAAAAALSGCVPYAGIGLPEMLALGDGLAFPVALLGGSAIGSFSYWILVRALWLPNLVVADAVRTVSFCVGATAIGWILAGAVSGFGAHNSELGGILPTISWWYAFSYSLWKSQQPAVAANTRSRGP